MKTAIAVLAGVLALACAELAPASARLDSFAGSCSIQGTAHFTPAVNPMKPGNATLTDDGDGHCSGTLNGARVSGAPVAMHVRAPVYADGCNSAHTTSPGTGVVKFADGTAIRFQFEFSGVLTEYSLQIQGERSGSAHGHATFITTRTQPGVAVGCSGLTGGLREAPIDISMTTDSPLVSSSQPGGRPTHPAARYSTFRGQCRFTGSVTFQPALSNRAHDLTQHVQAPGTCSGTLVNRAGRTRHLNNARAAYVAMERSSGASCAAGTAGGAGAVVLGHDRLKFVESETRAGVFVVAKATGIGGGSAAGAAAPTPDQNPVTAAQECAGSGIRRATIDIEISTTPAISG